MKKINPIKSFPDVSVLFLEIKIQAFWTEFISNINKAKNPYRGTWGKWSN